MLFFFLTSAFGTTTETAYHACLSLSIYIPASISLYAYLVYLCMHDFNLCLIILCSIFYQSSFSSQILQLISDYWHQMNEGKIIYEILKVNSFSLFVLFIVKKNKSLFSAFKDKYYIRTISYKYNKQYGLFEF